MSRRPSRRQMKRLTRKQISRRERERRFNQRLTIGVAIVLTSVLLILGWGLYDQYVLRPQKPVATVSGVPIRLDTYQALVRYRRWDYRNHLNRLENQKRQLGEDQAYLLQYVDQQIRLARSELMNLPMVVLDELIDDQLVRQECQRRGITVSPDAVQVRLEEQFGYLRNPPTPMPTPVTATVTITVTPTPTAAPMTREQFVERSSAWFEFMQEGSAYSEQDLRRLFEGNLYREKVEEALKAEVPTTGEQIHVRHILLEAQEEADDVLARLGRGEGFEELVAELSTDETNKDSGADLGWIPRGRMVPEFDEAAFALKPGQFSGVVETQFGFHVIRVDERDANRELGPRDLAEVQRRAIDEWFAERRSSHDVVRQWDSTMVPTESPTRVPGGR